MIELNEIIKIANIHETRIKSAIEKLGIIEDAEIWKEMRKTRNHIAHEYPDMPAIMAIYLNQIFDLSPKLINIFSNIKNNLI